MRSHGVPVSQGPGTITIVHRIGKDAFLAELDKIATLEDSASEREAFADRLLSTPAGEAEEYLALFYRGLTPEDLARAEEMIVTRKELRAGEHRA